MVGVPSTFRNGTIPPSYAVLFREQGGAVFAGELGLAREYLRLEGAGRAGARTEEVLPYRQIAGVQFGRSPHERIDGRSTLVIELRGGTRVQVTSAFGLGANHEIAERLAGLIAAVVLA
jgi:hypothetical protein